MLVTLKCFTVPVQRNLLPSLDSIVIFILVRYQEHNCNAQGNKTELQNGSIVKIKTEACF